MSVDTTVEAPSWFRDALAHPAADASVEVDGARIVYRSWGESGPQDVVLVHGGAAHSRWWDHIAPLLTAGRRVVALDLSGHGESDHREVYHLDRWADEVLAVAADAGICENPVVVGHSLGGLITLHLGRSGRMPMSGAIIIDSPVGGSPDHQDAAGALRFRPHRIYPTLDEGIEHFRPMPRQPVLPYVARHIAEHSLRAVAGGYVWKFDSRLFPESDPPSTLDGLSCPVVLLAGQHGIVGPALRETWTRDDGRVAVVQIPDAGHAAMVDQPIALLSALRGVLAGWAAR